MATNNCGHEYDCNCENYNEQCPPPQPPECEEPCTPCDEVTPSQCVIYTGPDIECIGVTTGMPLDTVIGLLAAKACETPEPPDPPEPPVPVVCVAESCENLNLCSPEEGCQSPVQYILNETLKMFCNQHPAIDDQCASPVQYLLNQVLEITEPTSSDCDLYPETGNVTTNNKENCKSSLEYALDVIFDTYDPEDPLSFDNILKNAAQFFQQGIMISNDNCDVPICCHECCEDGYYILSSMGGALAVFSILGEPKCCANSYFSALTGVGGGEFKYSGLFAREKAVALNAEASRFKNPLLFGTVPQCCTDQSFYQCIQTMSTDLNISSDLLTIGVVETQYAKNETLICQLYDKLKDPTLALTAEQQAEFIIEFLENGFVTLCCNGQVFIGGITAFGLLLQGNSIPCITIPILFDEFGPFCQNYNAELPTFSENGISGIWTPSEIVDTSVVGTFPYTFTSTTPPGLDPLVVDITVVAPTITPTFNPVSGPIYLEQGSVAAPLPATSLEGISGTWSPATIDTSTIGSFVYTFTPNPDAPHSDCAGTTTKTIVIYDPLEPPI